MIKIYKYDSGIIQYQNLNLTISGHNMSILNIEINMFPEGKR